MFGFCVEVTIRMQGGVNSHCSSAARDHNSDVSDPLRKRSSTNAVMRVENKSFSLFCCVMERIAVFGEYHKLCNREKCFYLQEDNLRV